MKAADVLKRCVLFSELRSSSLDELGRIVTIRHLGEDEVLFGEGEDAETFFILASGDVDLVKSSPGGREQLVRSVKAGEVFAEAAMFSGMSYPAMAIARSRSEILSIGKSRFISFLRGHPEVSLRMMGVMSNLLRHMNSLLAELSLGTVSGRLAAYLLKRMKEEGREEFLLDISKKELAFKIGTVPETLSRNLKRMATDGVLRIAGSRIIIKNINKLEDLAGR